MTNLQKLTVAAVKAVSPHMTCRVQDGEFRVSISVAYIMAETGRTNQSATNRAENMAYYTYDADDAAITAKALWARFRVACGYRPECDMTDTTECLGCPTCDPKGVR